MRRQRQRQNPFGEQGQHLLDLQEWPQAVGAASPSGGLSHEDCIHSPLLLPCVPASFSRSAVLVNLYLHQRVRVGLTLRLQIPWHNFIRMRPREPKQLKSNSIMNIIVVVIFINPTTRPAHFLTLLSSPIGRGSEMTVVASS